MPTDTFVEGARYKASNGKTVRVVSVSDKGWLTFEDSSKRRYRRKILSRRPTSGYSVEYVEWERLGDRYPKSWIEADKRLYRKGDDRW